jgi:insulysin
LYSMLDVPGLAFVVQSPAADAAHLFVQTETFLGSILDSEALTEEQFLRHRSALLQLLQEEPKNMWEQSDRYWQDIASAHYSFDSREKIIEALGKITLDDWRQYLAAQLDDDERSILLFNVGRWPEAREKLLNREMQVLNLPELVKFQQSQDKYLRP